mmetsp:Transcript_38723/g.89385  ORF Transcript_38723/g.89385 Transcript_38723/m.89385 type:complete len:237 (-) Transcript_38723:773-1483(-)
MSQSQQWTRRAAGLLPRIGKQPQRSHSSRCKGQGLRCSRGPQVIKEMVIWMMSGGSCQTRHLIRCTTSTSCPHRIRSGLIERLVCSSTNGCPWRMSHWSRRRQLSCQRRVGSPRRHHQLCRRGTLALDSSLTRAGHRRLAESIHSAHGRQHRQNGSRSLNGRQCQMRPSPPWTLVGRIQADALALLCLPKRLHLPSCPWTPRATEAVLLLIGRRCQMNPSKRSMHRHQWLWILPCQ